MLGRKNLGNAVLLFRDILEFINHNILHPLLPLFTHVRKVFQYVGCKIYKVVKVNPKAFLLLVKVAQKNLGVLVNALFLPLGLKFLVVQLVDIVNVSVGLYLLSFKNFVNLLLDSRFL